MGGHSQPRPRSADRHRRSAGRGPTANAPATCMTEAVSGRAAISCPATPKVNRTRRTCHQHPLPRGSDAVGRPASYHGEAAGLGQTSRAEKRMTKADLVEKVADVIGPRVTKRECGLMVEAFLDAVKDALAQGDRIELRGFGVFKVRHRKAQGPDGPQSQDRRAGRGAVPRCAGLRAFEAPPQPGGPRLGGSSEGSALGGHPRAISLAVDATMRPGGRSAVETAFPLA